MTNAEPAFPVQGACADNQFNGMSLRDWFAGQVLPAIIAQLDVYREPDRNNAVWIAFQIADEVMIQREVTK